MSILAKAVPLTISATFISLSLTGFAKELPFSAVSQETFAARNCRFQFGSEKDYRQKYIDRIAAKKGELPSNFEVHGVSFVNESPELVYRFMQLTTAVNFYGKDDPEAQVDIRKQLGSTRCTKVMCALETLFGKDRAEKMLFLLLNYDVNTSPYAYGNSSLPTSAELDVILEAFDLVPPHLLMIDLNQKMIKFARGYTRAQNSPNVVANATMEFFDLWSHLDKWEQVYSVYHELSHNWAKTLAGHLDNSNDWTEITRWQLKADSKQNYAVSDDWSNKEKVGFISKYAMTNPAEDFAETSSAYRMNPKKLKEVSPQRYKFMKDFVYAGIEFTDAKKCQGATRINENLKKQIVEIIKTNSAQIPDDIISQCRSEYADGVRSQYENRKYIDCIHAQVVRWGAAEVLNRPMSVLPRYLYNPVTDAGVTIDHSIDSRFKQASEADLKSFCALSSDKEIENRLKAEMLATMKAQGRETTFDLELIRVKIALREVCQRPSDIAYKAIDRSIEKSTSWVKTIMDKMANF